MPKSLNPDKYPQQYYDLLRTLPSIPSGLRITLPTLAEAQQFRFDIYAFTKALATSGTHPSLVLTANKYRIRITEPPFTVHFTPVEAFCPQAVLDALAALPPSPPTPEDIPELSIEDHLALEAIAHADRPDPYKQFMERTSNDDPLPNPEDTEDTK